MDKLFTSMKLMVPNDYLPFVYVTCSSFKCGVDLYGEGFVDEGKELR